MSTPALEFINVQKSYGDLEALKGVSFAVPEGQIMALLGPNGAGKTTLIGALGGIVRANGGEIRVFGRNSTDDPTWTKETIGIVPQELAFDPFFTPLESLRQLRGLFGLPRDDDYLNYLLEGLGLGDKKNTRARGLSGGMKRRLMIAKALAHKPKILILDEPTAGVDVDLRHQLWTFVRRLVDDHGVTVLLTTHYLEEAEEFAINTAIIQNGELIANAPTADLLRQQSRNLTITLQDGSVHKHEVAPNDTIGGYIRQYTQIADISIEEPSLEEVFLKLTHEFTANAKAAQAAKDQSSVPTPAPSDDTVAPQS